MKRNAEMTVRARTDYPDGAREDMSYTAPGTLEEMDGVLRFAYDEPETAGLGAVRTTLTLAENGAILTRAGAVRSEFRFAEGAPHESLYETAHGGFPARVTTKKLRVKQDARGALVELRYALDIGGVTGEHRLKLLIRTEDEI